MGLNEKRAIQEFQTNVFPKLKEKIDAAAGFKVAVKVDWEKLAKEGESSLYDSSIPKVYFDPIVQAFKGICADDMGKKALKENLKEIEITNAKGLYSPSEDSISFKGGTLKIDHEPTSNVDDVKARAEFIQKTLEAAL